MARLARHILGGYRGAHGEPAGALIASVVIPPVSYDRIDDQRQLRELLAQPAHDQINRLAVTNT